MIETCIVWQQRMAISGRMRAGNGLFWIFEFCSFNIVWRKASLRVEFRASDFEFFGPLTSPASGGLPDPSSLRRAEGIAKPRIPSR
jgi:hypothetical protein